MTREVFEQIKEGLEQAIEQTQETAGRAIFEKWLLKEQGLIATWNEKRGCYDEFSAHLAYKAWQAGREALKGGE